MQRYATHDLIYILIVFQAVLLLIVWSNWIILRRARQHKIPEKKPYLSVLIPARNEETNIARCVHSLLVQDYPNFEILVLDDQSDDATPEILCRLAAHEPRLTALAGQALPEGWIGKNWACHQLARQARGELLLFTDADTVYQPNALSALVAAVFGEQADVLTGFPDQVMQTWGERLTVPFFSWAFLTFTPLALAYRLRLPSLSSGVGQDRKSVV
jgi:chlorobactene glucosyltransferase